MSNWKSDSFKSDAFSGTSMSVRCYESHPILKMGNGRLIGGSASSPVAKDADVYVSLQSGSTSGRISDPWEAKNQLIEIQYSITDTQAPSNVVRFKKMVTWLCNQLHEGKTVHVGCVGGHGRTGVVFSAIVAEMKEEKDAIQWVRKHYCKKVVESKVQVQFLMKYYGVSEAEPSKTWESDHKPLWKKGESELESYKSKSSVKQLTGGDLGGVLKKVPSGVTSKTRSFAPLSSARSLWKRKKQ